MDLKTFREQNRLTQEDVAKRLKKHVTTISKYESGDTMPSLIVMGQIHRLTDGAVNEQDFIRVYHQRKKTERRGGGG